MINHRNYYISIFNHFRNYKQVTMCNKSLKRNQVGIGENETAVSNMTVKKSKQEESSGHMTSINSTEQGFLMFCKENISSGIEREPMDTFHNSSQIGKFSIKKI